MTTTLSLKVLQAIYQLSTKSYKFRRLRHKNRQLEKNARFYFNWGRISGERVISKDVWSISKKC
jgi:hypothetical protein